MGKEKTRSIKDTSKQPMRPGFTPESREGQLVSLAVDRAEEMLRDGTAPAQIIVHYLKLGSTVAKLEYEYKKKELDLMEAKTEQLKSMKRSEALMEEAIKAFREYSGNGRPDEDD